MAKIELKTLKIVDEYEKEQLYVVFEEGEYKIIVNVGEKKFIDFEYAYRIFEKVKELTKNKKEVNYDKK